MKSASFGIVVAATALLSSGCFSYVPVELAAVPLGENVRIYLTREELRGLAEDDEQGLPMFGPPRVGGTLVRRDDAGLGLRIPIASRNVGFLQTSIDRQVSIASNGIVGIEQRQLDRTKTAIMVGGTAGVVAGFVVFILQDAQRPAQEPDDEFPQDSMRLPLFSFTVP